MQIETGRRVAEIALLRSEDVRLDAPVPHVNIVEHREHGRRLKTGKSAERVIHNWSGPVLLPHGSPAPQQMTMVGSSLR